LEEAAARAVSPASRLSPTLRSSFDQPLVHRRGDALAATEFGNALLPAQPFHFDANLLFSLKVSTRGAQDVLDDLFRSRFSGPEFHLRSLRLR
jgi:hypothetical protein